MSRYVKDTNGDWQLSSGMPQIDDELDATSENTVQNKAIAKPISSIVNVLGAKNLLPNNGVTQTISGVTFTVNNDGTITANGTVTETYASFPICTMSLAKGRYKLSGCPSGFSNNVAIHCDTINVDDFGEGNEFELASDLTAFNIKFNAAVGVTFNNTLIKPMIRPASIADDTYIPYAMTNRELTLNLEYKEVTATTNANGLITIGDRGKVLPFGVVPITTGVEVTGVLLNEYGIYYARTNKNSTQITVGVFRKKIGY